MIGIQLKCLLELRISIHFVLIGGLTELLLKDGNEMGAVRKSALQADLGYGKPAHEQLLGAGQLFCFQKFAGGQVDIPSK